MSTDKQSLRRIVDLCLDKGLYQDAQSMLELLGPDLYAEDELRELISKVREKKHIYVKVGSDIPGGRSVLGDDDVTHMHMVDKGADIKLSYHLREISVDPAHLMGRLKWLMGTMGSLLGYRPAAVNIVLHSGLSFLAHEQYGEAGHFANGTIRLCLERVPGSEPQSVCVYVLHEFVHQVVHELSGGKCPRWLDEGLAVYFTQELSDGYVKLLKKGIEADKLLPGAKLEDSCYFSGEGVLLKVAYAQSWAMVNCLKDKIDWHGIEKLLKACAKDDFESEFKYLSGYFGDYYYDDFESDYKRWVWDNFEC